MPEEAIEGALRNPCGSEFHSRGPAADILHPPRDEDLALGTCANLLNVGPLMVFGICSV